MIRPFNIRMWLQKTCLKVLREIMVESKAPSPPASTGSGEWRHHRKSGWASPMVAFRLQFAARCEREGIPPRFTLDFYGYLFSLSTDSLFSVPSAIPKVIEPAFPVKCAISLWYEVKHMIWVPAATPTLAVPRQWCKLVSGCIIYIIRLNSRLQEAFCWHYIKLWHTRVERRLWNHLEISIRWRVFWLKVL